MRAMDDLYDVPSSSSASYRMPTKTSDLARLIQPHGSMSIRYTPHRGCVMWLESSRIGGWRWDLHQILSPLAASISIGRLPSVGLLIPGPFARGERHHGTKYFGTPLAAAIDDRPERQRTRTATFAISRRFALRLADRNPGACRKLSVCICFELCLRPGCTVTPNSGRSEAAAKRVRAASISGSA